MVTVAHERDLARVAPKDSSKYGDISLAALTVYSLYWLHKWELRRTIEAVAVLNWRLFPDKFGMIGFPEYPDAFRTNRSLLQCQPKYRNWLTGGATNKGFSLNQRGIELAEDLIRQLGVPLLADGAALGEMPQPRSQHLCANGDKRRSLEPQVEVDRVRKSRLFQRWKASEVTDKDLIHVAGLLDIYDHTPVRVRNKKMKDLEASAADVNDTEVLNFLADVRRIFPIVFAG